MTWGTPEGMPADLDPTPASLRVISDRMLSGCKRIEQA